tara:strand:+ start:2121 stop:3065 length:945 start_codon:yes stop_codon:yes gene_type:complete
MYIKIIAINIWLIVHKIFYYRLFNKKKVTPINKPFKKINSDNKTIKLISSINNFLSNLDIEKEFNQKINYLPDKLKYRADLYDLLNDDLKARIYSYALFNKKIRSHNLKYFGFNPRIHKIELLYNIPNKNLKEEGSKSWHRDLDCDFKNIKLFMPLKQINSNNGPFFYLKDEKYNSRFKSLKTNFYTNDSWKKGRVSNKTINKYGKNIDSFLSLKIGDVLLIDTVNTYHKGGYCKSKPRLLLHISYQGSSWTSTPTQSFKREINFLLNQKIPKSNYIILTEEIQKFKKFKNDNPLMKYLKKIIYKLSNFFIFEI